MSLPYYVYCLFDAFGVPRYIGKGRDTRWTDHERYGSPTNTSLNEFLERTWILLEEIPKTKLRTDLSNEEASEIEIALIKAIGREPFGPLVNMTDGGEGVTGLKFSFAARERLAAIRRREWRDPSYRERQRASARGASIKKYYEENPAAVQALAAKSSEYQKQRWKTDKRFAERRREAARSQAAHPAAKEAFKARVRARWSDPAYRDKMISILRNNTAKRWAR